MSDLILKKLTLENFKSFEEAELELDQAPGLYFIMGSNRAEPELGANGVGKSTLFDAILWVLWGRTGRDARPANAVQSWSAKKNELTRVHLKFQRGNHAYEIVRTRNPNRLEIYEPDGPREIQQEDVPKLLGMSEEMFRRTVVLGQFETLFLDMRPEQQAQMFTEALSLNIWLAAVNEAVAAVTKAQAVIQNAQNRASAASGLLDVLAKVIADNEEKAARWDANHEEELVRLTKGIKRLQTELDSLRKAAVEKPPVPQEGIAVLTKQKEVTNIKAELTVLKRDMEATAQELATKKDHIKRLQTQKIPTCLECGQPISDAEHKKKLAHLLKEVAALGVVIGNQSAEAKDLHARAAKLEAACVELVDEMKSIKAKYEEKLEAWQAWQRSVNATSNELNRWQADLRRTQQDQNLFRQNLTSLRKQRADARAAVGDAKAVAAKAEEQLAHAGFWKDAFREIRLNIIDSTLVELEMATSRHAAMLGLTDWGIKFETERETKSGTVSYAFNVLLYPPGQDEPVKWQSYSGGESQRWQLAVAFGLSEVLLSRAGVAPSMEVLDEPTKGLSPVGVNDLLDHLRDRAQELGRAVFFVDHHSLDKGSFDGTLLVEKTKKGSTLTWV